MAEAPPRSRSRFGPYEDLGLLESGGMSEVRRARGPDGRVVAVKVARDDGPFADALRREATSLAGLVDTGVPRVLGHDLLDDQPWYAMELVEGRSLRAAWGGATSATFREELDDRAAPAVEPDPRVRVAQVAQVARVLARVHAAGLAHRDLKPENVLLRRSGETVLIDFGLAAAAVPRAHEHLPSALRAGSPRYVAPEVVAGRGADSRADLFALGVMLLEAATGAPPGPAGLVPGALEAALQGLGPWPDPDAPLRLAALLEPDPARRPSHAGRVAALLGVDPRSLPAGVPPVRAALRSPPGPEVLASDAVVILGGPGSGRSRTLEHVRAAWRTRGSVVVGVAGTPGLLLLWPAVRAALARLHQEQWSAVLTRWGAVLASAFPELARHPVAGWAPAPWLPPEAAAGRLKAAILAVFAAATAQGRTSLVVDDADLADAETRDLVLALVRGAVPGLRVAVATGLEDAAWEQAGCTPLRLGSWTRDDLSRLAQEVFGGRTSPALAAWATEGATSAGVVVERLSLAASAGLLAAEGEEVGPPAPLPEPGWVARARFASLEAGSKLALAGLVARGRAFDLRDALATGAALPELGRWVRASVVELTEAGGVAFPSERAWAVAAEACRAELPLAHGRLAAALADFPDRAGAHLEAAGDLAGARRAWRRAALDAERSGLAGRWVQHAEAVVRTGGDGADRLSLARALVRASRPAEARAWAEPLVGDPSLRAGALLVQAASLRSTDPARARSLLADATDPEALLLRAELEGVAGHLDRAERELRALVGEGPEAARVPATLALARCLRERGKYAEGAAVLHALDPATLEPTQELTAVAILASLEEAIGDLDAAERNAQRALALAEALGDLAAGWAAARTAAMVAHLRGDQGMAHAILEEAIARTVRTGDAHGEAVCRLTLASQRLSEPECEPELIAARRRFAGLGMVRGELSALNSLGLHASLGARPGVALRWLEQAIDLASRAGMEALAEQVLAVNRAEALLAVGRPEALDAVLALRPDDPRVRRLAARREADRGALEPARAHAEATFGVAPVDADADRTTAARQVLLEQDRGTPEAERLWLDRVAEPALRAALRLRGGTATDEDRERVDAWLAEGPSYVLGEWWAHAATWRCRELDVEGARPIRARLEAWLAERPELAVPEVRAGLRTVRAARGR